MPDKARDILILAPAGLKTFLRRFGALQAIRKQHKDAYILALVPTALFDFARDSGCFDEVVTGWRGFLKRRFTHVYDLRGGLRVPVIFRFLRGRPVFAPPPQDSAPDLAFLTRVANCPAAFDVPKPYVLLLAGVSPRHPEKRWPPRRYAALAMKLAREGFHPVLLGTDAKTEMSENLARFCPQAVDLCGRTSLFDIAALAREAAAALGNDTGAAALVALTGCPTQVIAADDSVAAVYRNFSPRRERGHAVRA